MKVIEYLSDRPCLIHIFSSKSEKEKAMNKCCINNCFSCFTKYFILQFSDVIFPLNRLGLDKEVINILIFSIYLVLL